VTKLEGNAARDKLHRRNLKKLGWRVIVIWECETEKVEGIQRLQKQVVRLLS
jgi:DNA mismatch endonuclease (patch repair protein)